MEQKLGPYELIARIGAGGMATVYRALDTRDGAPAGRFVALKVLHDYRRDDEDYIRRFDQEARLATRLHHPNIVEVYEAGSADGQHYLAMELVEGETLADRLGRRRRLRPDEVRAIAIAVGSALEEAHRHRVAHRDIKPGNVLMGHDGSIKVSDFGIARALDATSQTMTGTFLGSVAYASPESIQGRTDPRGDLYSLGVLLYQCLLGHVPFEAANASAVMRMHERDAPPDLERLRAADPELGRIIERLLAKDPDDRYQSASHLLRALNAGGAGGGRWGAVLRWGAAGFGALALAGGGVLIGLYAAGVFDDESDAAPDPPATVSPSVTSTADPRHTGTPTSNAATATVVAQRKTVEADIWIRGAATAAAHETQTVEARTPSPTATPTTPTANSLIAIIDVSPGLNSTVANGDDIDVLVDYRFPQAGRSIRLTAYFRVPLSAGATSATSTATTTSTSGTQLLTVTANTNGAVFCGYAVDAGSGVRQTGGVCAPR